jgi:hypothetical protein
MPADVDHPEVTTMAERNGRQAHGPPIPPIANGEDGSDHDHSGRFRAGNRAGQGTRFVKGNQCSKGHANPFARDVARVRAALFHSLKDADMRAVVNALVGMVTEEHNLDAARLLLAYCIGPPLEKAVDPDRADLDELRLLQECPPADALVEHRLPPDVALALRRAAGALAAVAVVANELEFSGSRPHVLDALKDANLDSLAEAARRYADQLSERADP